MPENTATTPAACGNEIRESTCIHTKKIYDSCQAKDCVEDLRLYPTCSSQPIIDSAMSLRAGSATLLYVYMDVQPVGLGRGYYTVDMRFFYKITAEATAGCAKCAPITGLAIFDKRSILFGSEGRSKHFTSENSCQKLDCPVLPCDANLPTAICEAVDPLILSMRLVDCCAHPSCCCEIPVSDIPPGILSAFDEEITFSDNTAKRIYCTLGQFSILYMERDSQLLIPMYDYCMPGKECNCEPCDDDPCDVFQQVDFPVGDFFPPNTTDDLSPMHRFCNKP